MKFEVGNGLINLITQVEAPHYSVPKLLLVVNAVSEGGIVKVYGRLASLTFKLIGEID